MYNIQTLYFYDVKQLVTNTINRFMLILFLLLIGMAQAHADELENLVAGITHFSTQESHVNKENQPQTDIQIVPLQNNTQQTVIFNEGGDPLEVLIQDIDYNNPQDFLNPILSSNAAIIVDAKTGKHLYEKNSTKVMPIASITKLMSAMVFLDTQPDFQRVVSITNDDVDRLKNSGSRLIVGTQSTQGQLLHLGLMSSENRAIHALSRQYAQGGKAGFVAAMNQKAKKLGLNDTVFYDPTGLDPRNVSTAGDLVKLVQVAYQYPLIRNFSTSNSGNIKTVSGKVQHYKNSNALVRSGNWNIGLQKTGYIRESGRSMVVRANINDKEVIMVLLNSPTSKTREQDALKVSDWMTGKHI